MLNKSIWNSVGRFSFRAANSGLYIGLMFISSIVMDEYNYSKVVILIPICVIFLTLVDIFPLKYMLSKLSSKSDSFTGGVTKILYYKILVAIPFSTLISAILYFFFDMEINIILSMQFICLLSSINVSYSSFYFVNKEYSYILSFPVFLFSIFPILIFFPYYSWVLYLVLAYRLIECVVYYSSWRVNVSRKDNASHGFSCDLNILDGKYFYMQNCLSILGGRVYALLMPILLLDKDIVIIGNYMLMVSIFIFVTTYISSSYYVDKIAKSSINNAVSFFHVMKEYLFYSSRFVYLSVVFVCMLAYYLYDMKPIFFMFFFISATLSMFTSIQSFLLFKFNLVSHVFKISLISLCVNFILIITLAGIFNEYSILIASVIMEIVSIMYCFYHIREKINNEKDILSN
ncbi:hypothetical protein [Vibrio sp. 1CM8B]|uniref:hypothetical protein n=1 Tax=Vibrio sp. 1CM8B TaxID=2929167 RepID=UPI0020BF43E8|nr:hypothetical protein [Vibrio sp. 1CM8B]MCK8087104.1 hypothetical protein [Vibrio sp. 1CM8B]